MFFIFISFLLEFPGLEYFFLRRSRATPSIRLLIPLPNFPEQTAIAEILSDMDSEIEVLEQKYAKYKQIKKGMMHQLLTGKIRLVNK